MMMGDKVDIRLYNTKQLKDWLYCNEEVEGLSEVLIDKTRAHALVTNPYVSDDMSLVSALFVNNKLVAYTCTFPDRMAKPKDKLIYWNTTLYVDRKYEGRGYAYCVIAQICELYGENYFDLDAAVASVENLKYQGLQIKYLPQYVLEQKAIRRKGLKGNIAGIREDIRMYFLKKEKELRKDIAQSDYHLEYVNWVDSQTYSFIQSHADKDMFLRRQETFNWVLQNPFMQESPVHKRVRQQCQFSSTSKEFGMYGVRVLVGDQLIGFMILRASGTEWAVKYLYYEESAAKQVYFAVAEHLLLYKKHRFSTADKRLHDFIARYRLFAHDTIVPKSFAYPKYFEYDERLYIQAGEGDNVT